MQMHCTCHQVKVSIPLQETLKNCYIFFIPSLSDWTLHFREHWQSIRLKKAGKRYHFSCMKPHHKDIVKNDQFLLNILTHTGFLLYTKNWIKHASNYKFGNKFIYFQRLMRDGRLAFVFFKESGLYPLFCLFIVV